MGGRVSKTSPLQAPATPRSPQAPAPPQNDKRKLAARFADWLSRPAQKPRIDCARPEAQACPAAAPEGRASDPAKPGLGPVAERGAEPDKIDARPVPADPVEPFSRALAQPALATSHAPAPSPAAAPVVASEELLLEQLVRRLSWGGNGKRGSARLELGAGQLAGTTVVLHVEGREVALELEGRGGAELEDWRARIVERLEARGLVVR